jgi:hypothetical protein
MTTQARTVLIDGRRVGVLWQARGGYTLRTGQSLVRPNVHHFSPNEGLPGVLAYLARRFDGRPEIATPDDDAAW